MIKNASTQQFLFGLATGVAIAASANYGLALVQAARAPRRVQCSSAAAAAAVGGDSNAGTGDAADDADMDMCDQDIYRCHLHHHHHGHPAGAPRDAAARLEKAFNIPKEKLHEIVKHLSKEMTRGLHAENQTVKMIPSFVVNLPTGTETGTMLALDLGGSNLRVCEVTLEGAGKVRMRQKKYVVSDELKTGTAGPLFDFMAECVAEFVAEPNGAAASHDRELVLGFTFSFPCHQTAINQGCLIHWTKGFTTSGVEGKDPVLLLQEALQRKNLRVRAAALVNDTVGALVAHAYEDPSTYVGVILGTGTNAAYVERIDQIPKWHGAIPKSGQMVINMEWGAFDEEGVVLPTTEYDIRVDRHSAHPRLQPFEKMISGLYLGEIFRYVLVELVSTGELFSGMSSPQLSHPYSIDTALLSRIERDHSMELSDTRVVFEDLLGLPKTSLTDRRLAKRVAELIGTRSARLAAAGIAAIIARINRLDGCTVAIDGSLFEHYPHYANRMRDALRELVGIAAENITLVQARDGSGQGAALIAALAE